MMLEVTEVTSVSLSYLVLGGFVVLFSMMSLTFKERLYIGEVVLGTGFGIIIGPHCAGIFEPRSWGSTTEAQNKITLEVMRVVLATGLFAIGVELPKSYLADHFRSLVIMVVPTMAFGWLVVAGIIKALFPALTFVSALAIAACLTPTDPVLAAAIIGGKFAVKNVPGHIRRILSAESAANDGLAYPFLSISIYLAVESNKRVAFGKWFLIGWLYQVILGTVIGTVLGIAFSHFMKIAHRKGLIDRESFVAQYLALAIFTIGVANSLGSDDLLAAFAAGSAVSWDGHFNARTEDEVFSSVIDLVLNCACFIYIGAWLPFESYNTPELGITPWRLVILLIAVLTLRRIPSLLMLYKFVPDIHTWQEALFCGHFGPMGVGAIFISTLAITELPEPNIPPASQNELLAATLHPIVSFIVLGSILIHGLSIPIFWFGRKFQRRTLSMTNTLTRTLTSRAGQNTQPEWLYSTQRGTLPMVLDGATTPTRTPGEMEHGRALTGDKQSYGRGLDLRNSNTSTACARNSVRQAQSRRTSISSRSVSETENNAARNVAEEERLQSGSGEEVAGLGYASLHNAKYDSDIPDERNIGEGTIQEAEEGAMGTVHFRRIFGSGEASGGDAGEPSSEVKQVQFAQ